MLFFFILLGLSAALWLANTLGLLGLGTHRQRMRVALAATLIFFGIDHLLTPERYLPMVEGMLYWPGFIVAFTGLCELAGAAGLLLPRWRRLAGIMLAIYFVAVFPANIRNALVGLNVSGLPQAEWYYWVRLAFQPLAVWWSLFCVGVTSWPLSALDGARRNAGVG